MAAIKVSKTTSVPGQSKPWVPEDEAFWKNSGKAVASRNLWLSIPCLLCAFAVWSYWSIITVQMKNLGFPFSSEQLFTLTAVAGLTGATLRIPNAFLVAIAGGRNVIAFTTAMLLIPTIGAGIALQDKGTSFATFVVLAALSGIGGGNFASSMSNINFFFPKRILGTALGLNAGLGNLGVSAMQVLLPFVMSFGLFGAMGGGSLKLPGGSSVWIQNGALVWVPILVVLTGVAAAGMTNLPIFEVPSTTAALLKVAGLSAIGMLGAAFGLWLLLALKLSMWLALPITVLLTLLMMRLVPGAVAGALTRQFVIFRMKHTWAMTWLYVMTFGSFIGYSMAFPLLIRILFGTMPDGAARPGAPNPFTYAWLGPLAGSLARPIGGWLSDKWSGAKITQMATALMVGAALGLAYLIRIVGTAARPEESFAAFLGLFLLLFLAAGIGNGSTFRMIPIIFKPEHAGPVLGWTSAIAAYGAFIVPRVLGGQIEARTPENALYGFAAYYVTCLFVNWWYYARRNAEVRC